MNKAQFVFKAVDIIGNPSQNAIRYKNVLSVKDIAYGNEALNKGDLYYIPEILNDGKKHPVIVYYHGGAFLAGDNIGFENLVIRYKDGLIYYLNKIIKNITIAEDLAQDAFVEVYVHKERFVPGKASFKTYLYSFRSCNYVPIWRRKTKEWWYKNVCMVRLG